MTSESESSQRNRWQVERSHSFLLRCWQEPHEDSEGSVFWRFSLTHINKKREKKGFASLEDLVAYLNNVLERPG